MHNVNNALDRISHNFPASNRGENTYVLFSLRRCDRVFCRYKGCEVP